jgi:hypothetical protein
LIEKINGNKIATLSGDFLLFFSPVLNSKTYLNNFKDGNLKFIRSGFDVFCFSCRQYLKLNPKTEIYRITANISSELIEAILGITPELVQGNDAGLKERY